MLVRHVAIVSESTSIQFDRVLAVSAAIQKQVTRDFSPIWNINATVDAFRTSAEIPIDYWQVRVADEIADPTETGFHREDHNQPFAQVLFTDDWSISASHEVLEMLVDPAGDQLIAGDSVKPGQGRVRYLVEVCDPVQTNTYSINDSVEVCDFVTPQFYDPISASGVRYSFSGTITQPKQIVRGGYLSFLDSQGHWWRYQWFNTAKPTIIDLGTDSGDAEMSLRNKGESLREMMDRVTREHLNYIRKKTSRRQKKKAPKT